MMSRNLFFLLLFCFSCAFSIAQTDYIVFFNDKGEFNSEDAKNSISERSLLKRKKKGLALDYHDQRMNQYYIDDLSHYGEIKKKSRWLNAVVLTSDYSMKEISKLNFIRRVLAPGENKNHSRGKPLVPQQKNLEYGLAEPFIDQLNIGCMHDKGFLGEDIIIAVLDAGFRGMDTIPAFDSLYQDNRVIDVYDFVDNDQEVYEKSSHGTRVSSVIAANQEGYIAAAPQASLCLYITEDVSQEVNEEEFDLVLGLERADSVGADLVNISLSYFQFDSLQTDYSFDDLDGQTTISSIGVQIAADKGILVVTSAGNSGPSHISTPCDGDSVLCVGATNPQNELAGFSSLGPTADGRIKPDIAAMGSSINCIAPDGSIGPCFGTSFSSPLACGMSALLVQAYPELGVNDILNGIRMSGHISQMPNNFFGYGIPDACLADSLLDQILNNPIPIESNRSRLDIYPNPAIEDLTIEFEDAFDQVEIFSLTGKRVLFLNEVNQKRHSIQVSTLKRGMYIIRIDNRLQKKLILH
ncbi:MAG: S8/S53 family peptidase [Bacteroidota bacterium]